MNFGGLIPWPWNILGALAIIGLVLFGAYSKGHHDAELTCKTAELTAKLKLKEAELKALQDADTTDKAQIQQLQDQMAASDGVIADYKSRQADQDKALAEQHKANDQIIRDYEQKLAEQKQLSEQEIASYEEAIKARVPDQRCNFAGDDIDRLRKITGHQ